jgi:hypothetical protein
LPHAAVEQVTDKANHPNWLAAPISRLLALVALVMAMPPLTKGTTMAEASFDASLLR